MGGGMEMAGMSEMGIILGGGTGMGPESMEEGMRMGMGPGRMGGGQGIPQPGGTGGFVAWARALSSWAEEEWEWVQETWLEAEWGWALEVWEAGWAWLQAWGAEDHQWVDAIFRAGEACERIVAPVLASSLQRTTMQVAMTELPCRH